MKNLREMGFYYVKSLSDYFYRLNKMIFNIDVLYI